MEKMTKDSFEELYEILFSEKQTLNSGTTEVLFNQKQGLLKNKKKGEIIPTNIFASSEELGRAMIIQKYCIPD